MTALFGVIRKELKIAFTTPIAYVVFFFFTLLTSLLFYNQLIDYESRLQRARHFEDPELLAQLNFNDVILAYVFLNVQLIFVFLIPMLTMRAFSEEKRQRTMELWMTAPITPWQVVLGKYAAFLVVLVCLCGVLLVYPALLSVFGTSSLVGASVLDWPTTALGLLGIFVMGAMFGAVGMAFSTTTENQIVSALMSFFALLLLWFVARLGQDTGGLLGELLRYASPLTHVVRFIKGILHFGDLAYFLSVTWFFLFLTHRVVEGQRWR